MITSGSTEFFPLIRKLKKPNVTRQGVFISKLDVIDVTAENIISNGGGNFVGESCESINLLNCIGCSITSGVTGVNLIDCSGITVSENDVTFIDNLQITEGSFISSGVTFNQSYTIVPEGEALSMTTDNYTVEVFGTASEHVTLPNALGQTQVYHIKSSKTEVSLVIFTNGTDTIDGISTQITIGHLDTVTLQSNGADKYIIL
jgi:hypothetical protein